MCKLKFYSKKNNNSAMFSLSQNICLVFWYPYTDLHKITVLKKKLKSAFLKYNEDFPRELSYSVELAW